jgi:UDP:flavonoid glycosyltransferase YjiC (YdhE family)
LIGSEAKQIVAKFFIELSTGIGPLIRCLPITLWLRQRGHEVRYFARDD